VAQALFDPLKIPLKMEFNYQLLFRKEACTSRLDLKDQQKSSLKMEIRAFILLFFLQVHPERYFAS